MSRSARDEPRFGRPQQSSRILPPFIDEAARLRPFVPPFRFTQFFSPEDTLLCVCASEEAMRLVDSSQPTRIVEFTTGSGLVGLEILLRHEQSTLLGLDVDTRAVKTAADNAVLLGVNTRARFDCADIWSNASSSLIADAKPDVVICNPPYVPEPPQGKLQIEAGAGDDGTAHLMRTIELVKESSAECMALSWCSLSDPAKIVSSAAEAGYALRSLFMVAIADGEYSGSVHEYLRELPHAYISETAETLHHVAPDGSARFAYLLMAGSFVRTEHEDEAATDEMARLCDRFASTGLSALVKPNMSVPTKCWLLDRWDELRLRALLH